MRAFRADLECKAGSVLVFSIVQSQPFSLLVSLFGLPFCHGLQTSIPLGKGVVISLR